MAITRLKRKALRNKIKAKKRQKVLKHLLFTPVIKSIENLESKSGKVENKKKSES